MESKLKEKRMQRNMSQEQLARKTKISKRTIQDYEQRRRNILKAQVGTVRCLAKALRCSIEELLDEE